MLFVYKILIIILLIIIFYLIINVNIECFTDKKNYTNTNEYPMSRLIKSKLPYDLVVLNNKNNLYDFGNDEIEGKLSELLNITNDKIIKNIDGIEWGDWINSSDLKLFYNQILLYLKNVFNHPIFTLPYDKNKFKIIKHSLVRYKVSKTDSGILLLDIDVLIYRKNKPLARHIKFLVRSNGVKHIVVMAKVIGVLNECDLNDDIKSYNKNNYKEFNPIVKYKYDMNSFIYDTNEKLVHSEIEYNLYNKILKEL
jgi:hypothetical protein